MHDLRIIFYELVGGKKSNDNLRSTVENNTRRVLVSSKINILADNSEGLRKV